MNVSICIDVFMYLHVSVECVFIQVIWLVIKMRSSSGGSENRLLEATLSVGSKCLVYIIQ